MMEANEEYSTVGPKCPSCGYVETDLEAIHYDESMCELECGSCAREYDVQVYTSTSWTTTAHLAQEQ